MIQYIVNVLINQIIEYIKKLWFKIKTEKQKEIINESVKNAQVSEDQSNDAANDFLSKYEEYKRKRDDSM